MNKFLVLLGGFTTFACWASTNPVSAELKDSRLLISGVSTPIVKPVHDKRGYVELKNIQTPPPKSTAIGKTPLKRVSIEKVGPTLPQTQAKKMLPPTPPKKVLPTTFFVAKGEAPLRAIQSWFKSKNINRIAWALDNQQRRILLTPVKQNINFTGTLPQTIKALGKRFDLPLDFDVQKGIAAVHTLDTWPQIEWVHGQSLKEAVANITRAYGWTWVADGPIKSWTSKDDYPLMAPYAIVTPRGALDLALDTILDGYPVRAELIESSRLVIIREKE
ncbi:hypothetical protein NTH40_003025 [Vibrio harveyi]|nr:hypothetical protein [Vibrio harveyi]